MRSPKLTVLLSILLLATFAATAAAESRSFSCRSGGSVFTYLAPHSGPLLVNLTWAKVAADNDILVFNEMGDLVGLGLSFEPRFEQLVVGALPVVYDIVAAKFDGPNSRCYLYLGSSDGGLIRASSRERLRYRGSLEELTTRNPRYEKMWNTYQRMMRSKGGGSDR